MILTFKFVTQVIRPENIKKGPLYHFLADPIGSAFVLARMGHFVIMMSGIFLMNGVYGLMIWVLTVLLVYQLAGEVLVVLLDLPVPGPVMGMVFLFVTLLIRGSVPEQLRTTAQGLLRHLSLLFVPAGVGVMVHFSLVADVWLPVLVTLVLSILITLGVTGWTMQLLSWRKRGR